MSQLPEMVRQILEKLLGFFDLFDLSFFVSGVMVFAGCLFLLHSTALRVEDFPIPEWGQGFTFGAVVLACYILGLMAFALGRWIRSSLLRPFVSSAKQSELIWDAIGSHRLLDVPTFKTYLQEKEKIEAGKGDKTADREKLASALYTRLWAELRQSDGLEPSFLLIKRYWILCATYDGVGIALVFWMMVAVSAIFLTGLMWQVAAILCVCFFALALGCFREASRYQNYQVVEIVATLAYKHQTSKA